MGTLLDQSFQSKRYLVILIASVSILLITGAFFYFSYETNSIRKEKYNDLKAISGLKISQIERWRNELYKDAKIFSEGPFLAWNLERLISSKNQNAKSEILKKISLIRKESGYENIIVTDINGKPLITSPHVEEPLDSVTISRIKSSVNSGKISSTDLFRSSKSKKIYLDFIAPVLMNHRTAFVLILRVNPEKYLYPLIRKWSTVSRTSETMLVERKGNCAVYLNNLRFRKNIALNYREPLTHTKSPAVKAALGYRGVLDGINSRGSKILAYITSVPNTNWIMIAKIDDKEVFSSLLFRETVIVSGTILLIMFFGLGLFWYYHFRQRNIFRELFNKEKDLREYHEEFKTILYSIGDGVVTTDTEGKVKQMNHVAEELTGWTESESVGKNIDIIFNIINEEKRQKAENPVYRVLKEGTIVGLANHTILIVKDGTEIPIADSGAPIRNEKGDIEGVVLVFRDKTSEYYREKLVRQSEARLNRAELASKSGNWELYLNTMTMISSKGAAKIYGFAGEKYDYETIKKVPLPEYRLLLDNALKNLIEKGEPYDVEFKIRSYDKGEIKYIHSIAEYDKNDNIIFGVIQDITERKGIEEEKFRLLDILENSLNEIYVFDPESLKFEYVNRGAMKNLGYSQEEINNLSSFAIKPEFSEETFRKLLEPLLNGQKDTIAFETVHKRKDGSTYPVEAHYQLHKTGDKNVFFAIINDITDRKKAQNEILRNRELLQLLVEYAPAAIAMFDTDMKYLAASRRFVADFELGNLELIGRSHYDIFPEIPESRKEVH